MMSKATSRRVQYLVGLCGTAITALSLKIKNKKILKVHFQSIASFAYTFTGAVNTWASHVILKFNNSDASIDISESQVLWAVSLSALGVVPGCFLGRELSERAGRHKTIMFSSVARFIDRNSMYKEPGAHVLCEVLLGIGNGITAVVTMIYLTEIADKEIRGVLGMLVQVMHNLGSLVTYGVGLFVSYSILNAIVLFISVFYALLCLWVPETPYYYLACGNAPAAKKAFMILKSSKNPEWAEEQLEIIRVQIQSSMENKSTLTELFKNIEYRKAIYITAGLKVLQYMTGSLAIQSYLEVIFRQSSSISGPTASIVYGLVQFLAGIGATLLTRYFGRRILLLLSSLGVGVSLTIVGVYFFMQDSMKVSEQTLFSISALPSVGVLSFNIIYACGLGNLPYVMQAELFPINVKIIASSVGAVLASILAFLVIKSYQNIKDVFGHYTVFWSFASIAYLGVFFIYYFVPETKDMTLEEVQDKMEEKILQVERLNTSDI